MDTRERERERERARERFRGGDSPVDSVIGFFPKMNRGGLDDFIVDIEEGKRREGKGSRDVFIGRFLLRCSCEDDVMLDRLGRIFL